MDADLGGGEAPVQVHKEAGAAFGKYTLLCKLATGGMGELHVGRQTGAGGFEKLVVIKRLLPHLAEDAHFVAMLLDEARIAARLSHPNVCQVYDLGEAEGHYYIAMEHLEGVPASLVLRRARRAGQKLDLGLAAAILRQACDGLHHAHELTDSEGNLVELVHRDVSPSNLFVTASGLVKVLDFGVAKSQDALARTHTGALKGKYAYMSPEQVLGNPVDRRADVFSLGVVLFELLTAQRLFWRDSEYKMFQAIVEDPIPSLLDHRPGLPPAVGKVVDRALSRDPERRFASARDLGEALEEAVSGIGLWKSSAIGDYVSTHFADLIEEKRRDVQQGIARADRVRRARPALSDPDIVIERPAATPATPVPAAAAPADAAPVAVAAEGTLPVYTGAARPARGRRWLGAAALAIALGGAGAVAYQKLSGERAAAPTQVTIIGGEVVTEDGRVARAARPAGAEVEPGGEGEAGSESERGAASGAGAGADGAAAPDGGAGPSGGGRGGEAAREARSGAADDTGRRPRDPYRARLARHQRAIRRCFNENATTVQGAPELDLALRIDAEGKVLAADLLPAALADTALGTCVLAIARKVDFGPQEGEVGVTIPLKVRVRKAP
ncbi:MAG TPA: protein kinase [Kofleriaceae bacterium]|nr:protein kinase [Kofleriaceae bacterium]